MKESGVLMPHAQNTLTKAEFEAGLKALEERLTQRFERLLLLQQTFAELDRIKETANVNPKGHTEEDVPLLVKEMRGELAAAKEHR